MDGKSIRLLVIEDNPGDIRILEELFAEHPAELLYTSVTSGVSALQHLRECSVKGFPAFPQLILLDWNLPGIPGAEVLKEIKEDPKLGHIPVVVVTSSEDDRDIQLAYRLHASCFITKPVKIEEYYRVVDALLSFWTSTAVLPDRWLLTDV